MGYAGGHGYIVLTASYLRFVADEDVVLHGVGDVVHRELQEGPLWDINQANTCPGGTAVQGVWPWNDCHPLKKQEEEDEEWTFNKITSIFINFQNVTTNFKRINAI